MDKNNKKLFNIFAVLLILVGIALYFLIFESGSKKVVEDKKLSGKDLFELKLKYSKPTSGVFMDGDFKYCEGEDGNFDGCSEDFKSYSSYKVGTEEYQMVNIDLKDANIKDNQLVVDFYIYNYEQQGKIFCGTNSYQFENSVAGNDDVALKAQEICKPYTYKFNITKDSKTNEIIYTEVK